MFLSNRFTKQNKLLFTRMVFAILIILNMALIFAFSEQSGEESGAVSQGICNEIVNVIAPDLEILPQEEQQHIISSVHFTVRKGAHMVSFGSLGCLIFLFLLTWNKAPLPLYAASLAATFLYACSDEFHQRFSEARGPQFSDVLIDTCGALITCTAVLLIVWIRNRNAKKGVHPA